MLESESYSNPIAPSHARTYDEDDEDEKSRLTNSDFRKLMMTPRDPGKQVLGATPRADHNSKPKLKIQQQNSESAMLRKKRKSFYAQLKKEEDEREKEMMEKYRDRAKERREGVDIVPTPADISTTINYKAVAPEEQKEANYAARRKQVIEESKYLGGDMKHTHLVKGLDYSLLEKVKAEINNKEQEELEAALEAMNEKEIKETEVECRSKLAKDILLLLDEGRSQRIQRREIFEGGRMAYIFDLEDKEQDIPTTLLRSRAECNRAERSSCMSNNDIVVNKVIQIFNELRTGRSRDKKKKKGEKVRVEDIALPPPIEEDIFEVQEARKGGGHRRKEARDKNKSYFEKPTDEDTGVFEDEAPKAQQVHEFVKNVTAKFAKQAEEQQAQQEEGARKFKKNMVVDSYAECYPGMAESVDAFGDSDDEADYTKMDQGNKKGPVGRWDFENQEEYSSYMSAREAMPKAAFQYGVKMADGRKTRRAGPRDDKKEHDREWAKIQTMISKRRPDEGPSSKKPKV